MTQNLWDLESRSEDGSGNNLNNTDLGKANTPLSRAFLGIPDGTPALYGDSTTTADDAAGAPRQYPDQANLGDIGTPVGQVDFIRDVVHTTANIPNSYGTTELSVSLGTDLAGGTQCVGFGGQCRRESRRR